MWVASRWSSPVAVVPWPEVQGRVTAIVKLSYDVPADGFAVAAQRPDPLTGDASSPSGVLVFPTDYVRLKSSCDVLIVGGALLLPPAPTWLDALGIRKFTQHAAALGPRVARPNSTRVQHAPTDQRCALGSQSIFFRYRRDAVSIEATVAGPPPQLGVARTRSVEPRPLVLDTVALDPERRRIILTLRAVLEGIDLAQPPMIVVDELGSLPADANDLATWRIAEVGSQPQSVRPSVSRTVVDPETLDEDTVDSSRRDVEDEFRPQTMRMMIDPALLPPPDATPFKRAPALTQPAAVGRTTSALPFVSNPAPVPPPAAPPVAPPPPNRAEETTQLISIPKVAPALPFVPSPEVAQSPSRPPPAPPPPPTPMMADETTSDFTFRETLSEVGPSSLAALPFPQASSPSWRPIPPGVQPATPFERFGSQAPPPQSASPGFDLAPVAGVPRAGAPRAARLVAPVLSLDLYVAIRAELWDKKLPRRAVLKKHGMTDIQWRLAERTFTDQLAESKQTDQPIRQVLASLDAEVAKRS